MNQSPEELYEAKKIIVTQYLNDPATTGGRDRVFQHIRKDHPYISRRDVAKVLAEDPVAQQHRPLKKRATVRPIIVSDRAKVAQIDLVDFKGLTGYNDHKRYILTYVDLLSKYCAARALANKTQVAVTAALLDILDSMPPQWRPKVIQSDGGSEFQTGMARALTARNIKIIRSQPYNPRSQGAIERLNRTIKSAIFSLMSRHQSQRWIDFLQPLISNINNSRHESTGFTPMELMQRPELEEQTIADIHARMERKRPKHVESNDDFAVGDYVRVALTTESAYRKQTFRKKIKNNWSDVVFQIYSISQPTTAGTKPQYLLKNLTTNRSSKKKYWSYQLQKTTEPVPNEQEASSDEEEVSSDDSDEEVIAPVQQEQRRSSRAWAPSQEGLRAFAARR